MSYETIVTETRGEVRVITMNRPERRNAWTYRMGAEMAAAIREADAAPDIGAIVLAGAGKGFCAGADFEDTFRAGIGTTDVEPFDWVEVCRSAKPLVAAVHGAAVGVGLTQILPFDQIVAAPSAKFGMFFVKVGLVPELASTRFLVQRVGWGMASDLCLSGRLVETDEAARIGLVDRLVGEDELLDEAVAVAATYAANPAPMLAMIKQLLTDNAVETDLAEVQRREGRALRDCTATPEHAEAIAAFAERRPPNFPPRC